MLQLRTHKAHQFDQPIMEGPYVTGNSRFLCKHAEMNLKNILARADFPSGGVQGNLPSKYWPRLKTRGKNFGDSAIASFRFSGHHSGKIKKFYREIKWEMTRQ